MKDPFAVFDLPVSSDDATIRSRYLQLVREFPPEKAPEKFAEIRRAYEYLKDLRTRLTYQLFEAGQNESVDAIIKEFSCRIPPRRVSLETLIKLHREG